MTQSGRHTWTETTGQPETWRAILGTFTAILTRHTRTPAYALPPSELWLFPATTSPDRTLLLTVSLTEYKIRRTFTHHDVNR